MANVCAISQPRDYEQAQHNGLAVAFPLAVDGLLETNIPDLTDGHNPTLPDVLLGVIEAYLQCQFHFRQAMQRQAQSLSWPSSVRRWGGRS